MPLFIQSLQFSSLQTGSKVEHCPLPHNCRVSQPLLSIADYYNGDNACECLSEETPLQQNSEDDEVLPYLYLSPLAQEVCDLPLSDDYQSWRGIALADSLSTESKYPASRNRHLMDTSSLCA